MAISFYFIDVINSQSEDKKLTLEIQNFNADRKSQDNNANRLDRVQIGHCKGNNMMILNGRCFNDSITGKFTCDETSVIDYILCSSSLLQKNCEF